MIANRACPSMPLPLIRRTHKNTHNKAMHEIRNVLYFLMLIHRFVSALIYTPKLTYKYKYSFAIHENIVSISFYIIKLGSQGVCEMKKACVKQAFFMILSYSMFFLTWVRYSFIFIESLRSIISRRDDNCFCIPRT